MLFLKRIYKIFMIVSIFCVSLISTIPYQFGKSMDKIKKISILVSRWAKWTAGITGLKINIHGDIKKLPQGFYVSNHISYVDIILLASLFNIRFTPKKELRDWFFIGRFIRGSRPVWIDRTSPKSSSRTNEQISESISSGMNILLFPEGTTSDGRSLLPFKSAPFQASVDTGAPVVPFVISYRTPDVAWYGDMGFRRHIWDLLSNDTLEADIRTLQPIFPENLDRKELASLVHERMKPYMPGGNNSTEVFPSA